MSSNLSKQIPASLRAKSNQKLLQFESKDSKPISTLTPTTPVPTHDHITRLILDQKSATQALQTFRWASKLPHFTHNQSTYRAVIHKLCCFRRFDTVHQLLDEMPSSIGSKPDEGILITIVRGLGRARMVRQVVRVLDLVSKFEQKPTLKLCNSILDVLVKEDIDIAREFYRKKMVGCYGLQGDEYTFGILMKGLCLTNRINEAFKLLQAMKCSRGVMPNTVVYNTLIHALCKNGKLGIGRARSLLNEMVAPNDVTFNVLITAYCREDNLVQALVMLEKCFDLGFVPDVITVTKLLEILCSKDRAMEAVEVLERVEGKRGQVDVVAYNTLIRGFCKLKKAKVARRFLKEMELKGCLPNVDTYNALIHGFCECGFLVSALDMFNEMRTVGISWNFTTYDTLIRGLCSAGRMEDGFKILELMEGSKGGSKGRISPYNSIIYGLYKENRIDEAREFLNKMEKLFPRAVERSLKILEFCEEGSIENAKRVYDLMTEQGDLPSALVYVNLVRAFCWKKFTSEAFDMTNEMVRCGYIPDTSILNILVDALCIEGKVGSAIKFLDDMVGRGCPTDSGSYSPLLRALCRKGDFHKAKMIVVQMVEKGNVPDYFSWNDLVTCLMGETIWLEGKNICYVNDLLKRILRT